MKRFLPIIALLCILVFVVGVIAVFLIKSNQPNRVAAILSITNGSASVKRSGGYEAATDEQELQEGDYVKTGSASEATVVLSNNSVISMNSNTEIQLQSLNVDSGINIKQVIGDTWHRITNIASGKYTVETSSVVAAVRGTIFGVSSQTGADQIYVIESQVDLLDRDDLSKLITNIPTGKLAELHQKQLLGAISNFSADNPKFANKVQWMKHNQLLDKDWRELKLNLTETRTFLRNLRDRSKLISTTPTSSTDNTDFLSQFNGLPGTEGGFNGAQFCEIYQKYILPNLDQLAQYGGGFNSPQLDMLRRMKPVMEKICSDGVITESELEQLKALSNN